MKDKFIKDFAFSSWNLWKNHDPNSHLPFNPIRFYAYYGGKWVEALWELVQKAKEFSLEEIAAAMPVVSSCRFILILTVMKAKVANYNNKAKLREIFNFFSEVIKFKVKHEDVFAIKSNIIHTEKEIENILNGTNWSLVNLDKRKDLSHLTVGLGTLVHGLYNDFDTDFGFEVYGPYDVSKNFGENSTMLIREFIDLQPTELWGKVCKFGKVRVYCVYLDLDARIEFVGCHMTFDKNPVTQLTHYAAEIDGKQMPEKELNLVSNYFLKLAQEFFIEINKLSFEEKKAKYFLQEAYQLKKLCELLKVDWKTLDFNEHAREKPLLKMPFEYKLSFEDYCEKFGINLLK